MVMYKLTPTALTQPEAEEARVRTLRVVSDCCFSGNVSQVARAL